jgi:hypothetical protein
VNTSYFTGHALFAYSRVLRGCSSALFKLRSGKDFIFLFGVPSGRLTRWVRKIDQRLSYVLGFIVQDGLDLVVMIQEKIKKTPLRRLPLEWIEVWFTRRKGWFEIIVVTEWQLSLNFRL